MQRTTSLLLISMAPGLLWCGPARTEIPTDQQSQTFAITVPVPFGFSTSLPYEFRPWQVQQFNSTLSLGVYRIYAQGGGASIGTTPTSDGQPLSFSLGPGERWAVFNLADLDSSGMATLVQNMNDYSVPWLGLRKGALTHADLDTLKTVASLERLGLHGSWNDTDLQGLVNLTQVLELSLTGTGLSDAGLQHVSGLGQLLLLGLSRTVITNAGLTHLQGLTALQSLSAWKTGISGGALTGLQGLTSLRSLHLGWTGLDDTGLQSLSGYLPALETLHVPFTAITDSGASHIAARTPLLTLDLHRTMLTDSGVQVISSALGNLEHFDIQCIPVQESTVLSIPANHPNLTVLALAGATITGGGLNNLSQLNLPTLVVGQSPITDADLVKVGAISSLVDLDMRDSAALSDAGLVHLAGLSALKALNVKGTMVTSTGAAWLESLIAGLTVHHGLNYNHPCPG